MLIDKDSKPKDTIFYLATQLLSKIRNCGKIKLTKLNSIFYEIDESQPLFKYNLALNFLFLLNKVDIEGGELIYVFETNENY